MTKTETEAIATEARGKLRTRTATTDKDPVTGDAAHEPQTRLAGIAVVVSVKEIEAMALRAEVADGKDLGTISIRAVEDGVLTKTIRIRLLEETVEAQ